MQPHRGQVVLLICEPKSNTKFLCANGVIYERWFTTVSQSNELLIALGRLKEQLTDLVADVCPNSQFTRSIDLIQLVYCSPTAEQHVVLS